MKICILINGHYRSFDKNLEHNLLQLYPFLLKNNEIDVYILSFKTQNYSEKNQELMINIFKKYGCIVKYIFYWEDLEIFHKKSQEIEHIYQNESKHKRGIFPNVGNIYHQRYILNLIKNQICDTVYNLVFYIRLFDTIINIVQPVIENYIEYNLNLCINHDFLLGCFEFYIGKPLIIDKLFESGNKFELYHDDIWNNIQFTSFYTLIDMCLSIEKHTYAAEVQLAYYIYINKIKFKSFRFDYTYPESLFNNEIFIHKIHCPVRHLYK